MPPKKRRNSQTGEVRNEEDPSPSPSSGLPSAKRRRRTAPLQYDSQEICQELFETIRNHKTEDGRLLCEPFIRAPKRRTEPEYYNVVTQPIDLLKVHNRLRSEEYDDVEMLTVDIQLMIDNAKAYYKKSSQEYKDACELWELFTETKSVLLSEVFGDTVDPSLALPLKMDDDEEKDDEEDDDEEEEDEDNKSTTSMHLRQKRYGFREFLPIKASRTPKVEKDDQGSNKGDDDEDSALEELFTAVATATDAGRCISEMFKVLPSRAKYPDYYEIIKDPIDMRLIAKKLQAGVYAGLDDLLKDLNLMIANAKTFNEPGSQIYRDAVTMRKIVQGKHHEIEKARLTASSSRPVRSIRTRRTGGAAKMSAVIAALPSPDPGEVSLPLPMPSEDSLLGDGEDLESTFEGSMVGELEEDDPLWILFKNIKLHKNSLGQRISEPFLRLPNRRIYPDYYEDIKKPMSLLKVQKKLKTDKYKDLDALAKDLNLIFENAKQYNLEDSKIYKDATKLQQLLKVKKQELQQSKEDFWEGASEISIRQKRRNIETSSTTSEDSTREVKQKGKPGRKSVANSEETLRKRLNTLYKTVYDYQIDLRPLRDIFMTLPSKKDYPDYYTVICDPIDMTIIDGKIKNGMYQSQEALIADFELMFNNARHYNEESSQVYKDACTLERILMARVHSLPSLNGSPLALSGKRKSKTGPGSSLSVKLQELYNTIRDFKDAKMRVLSTPFMKLPVKTDLPDYYEVIKKPIDMNKMFQKLINHQYTSVEEMTSDFVLMFDNACKYNEPDSLIYKDALTLQRVCLEKKQDLCAEDDINVPDVRAAVHELMTNLFISTYNHTDEEGRCFSDSFLDLPSKIPAIEGGDVEEGHKMAPCFEKVKSNLDKGRYRRMDRFQKDMFEVFEYARKVSRTDSQAYEDSTELQLYFVRTRDELCKNGEVLLTPALSYTEHHLLRALEKERKERAESETPKDEEGKKKKVPTATLR